MKTSETDAMAGMTKRADAELIRAAVNANPLLADLGEQHAKQLSACATVCSYQQDEMPFAQGETADRFFLIHRGRVSLEIAVPGRGIVPVQTLHVGNVVGWSWLFPPYRWYFAGRALEPSVLIAFDAVCLRQRIDEDHEFGYQMLRRFSQIVIDRLQATRIQLLDLYAVAL